MSRLSYAVDFRGHPACPCLAEWLPVYERALQDRGLLHGPLHIYQLIGGAAASAGAHTKGGAFDLLDLPGNEDLALARQMGADATWSRPYNWDGRRGMAHMHGVLSGCPHALEASVAKNQLTAVRDGFNGLGHLGRGGRDTGPRPLSGRTWRQGIEWITNQEDDMGYRSWDQKDKDALLADLKKDLPEAIADEVWGRQLGNADTNQGGLLGRIAGNLGVLKKPKEKS